MHDESSEGAEFFRCDFCHKPWAEDRPMVEGHQGSLICGPCLTLAYKALVLKQGDVVEATEEACTLCLEPGREGGYWRSPAIEAALACKRCVKQSAGVLHKDADHEWVKPVA